MNTFLSCVSRPRTKAVPWVCVVFSRAIIFFLMQKKISMCVWLCYGICLLLFLYNICSFPSLLLYSPPHTYPACSIKIPKIKQQTRKIKRKRRKHPRIPLHRKHTEPVCVCVWSRWWWWWWCDYIIVRAFALIGPSQYTHTQIHISWERAYIMFLW